MTEQVRINGRFGPRQSDERTLSELLEAKAEVDAQLATPEAKRMRRKEVKPVIEYINAQVKRWGILPNQIKF